MKHKSRPVLIPITGPEMNNLPARPGWFFRLFPSGIRTRLLVLILLTLLPLLLLITWIYDERYETRRTQAMQTEIEVARGIATTLAAYVEGIHHQQIGLGKAILAGGLTHEQIEPLLQSVVTEMPAVRNLNWVSPQGVVLVSSMEGIAGQDVSDRYYMQQILAGKTESTGILTPNGVAVQAPTLGIATAIQDEAGVLVGIVVSGIEPTRLAELTLSIERPASGSYAIFDQQGTLIYHSTHEVTTWEERVGWIEQDLLLAQSRQTGQEQVGLLQYNDQGEEWIAARVPIEGLGWVAGAERPERIALEPVARRLQQDSLIAVLVTGMAFLLAILIAQTIDRPLYRLEQDARAMVSGSIETSDDPFAPNEVRRVRRTVAAMAGALIQRAENQRETAEALRESEERFRALFHNRHSPMLLIDPNTGQIIDANDAASAYYGWSQQELLSMKITQINQLPPTETGQKMKQAQTSASSTQFFFKHRLANGEIRDVEVNSGPIQVGEKRYLFSIIYDITERIKAERQLQERSMGLALLSEAASELLSGSEPVALLENIYHRLSSLLGLEVFIHYGLSDDGSYLEMAAQSGLDLENSQLLGRLNLGEGICGKAAEMRQAVSVADIQNSAEPRARFVRTHGLTTYVCFPLIIEETLVGTLSFGSRTRKEFDSQSLKLLSTTSDLIAAAIHRKRAEMSLRHYARKLEESNHDLQEFAFIASHDLQEPLRKIEAFGNILMSSSQALDETQRDNLERMRQAANRMRKMILDLLELSRVHTQARPFEPVDLSQTVTEILSDLEMQVKRTQGRVTCDSLAVVEADPVQMRQLMQNLIGNALKYHHPDVPPVVKISGKAVTPVSYEIHVEDNGIGFHESQLDRIFQPFQRLVGKSQYEGNGMGLAICRKIVERHHGSITASSVEGQGSVFRIILPVQQNHNSEP